MEDEELQKLSEKIDAGTASQEDEKEFLRLYMKFLKGVDDEIKIKEIRDNLQA